MRRDDKPVEVVVLDLAAEDAAERVFEHAMQRIDFDLRVGYRCEHAEIVHPDRRAAVRRDAMRPFVQHLHPHPLEHRQAVGQRHRSAQAEQLEAQRVGRGLERTIERHAERLGVGQLVHHFDVGHRGTRREILAVAGRERTAE